VFVSAEQDTNHKGNAAELAIAAEAARLGLSVFIPLTEHSRYDLVLEVGGRLLRVQCKWGRCDGETILVSLKSSYHSPTRGYVVRKYAADEVDAIAVYCEHTRCCYLLPIDAVAGVGLITLRLTPARNNQRAALNLAADYEFSGAVAQLEERVAGSDEVRGSSPLSSTHDPDLGDTVGMDEFYARLAHYVRYAERGGEVTITRWGRPVASLGPSLRQVALNAPTAAADE
jgi:prevent-host-death family protein